MMGKIDNDDWKGESLIRSVKRDTKKFHHSPSAINGAKKRREAALEKAPAKRPHSTSVRPSKYE